MISGRKSATIYWEMTLISSRQQLAIVGNCWQQLAIVGSNWQSSATVDNQVVEKKKGFYGKCSSNI